MILAVEELPIHCRVGEVGGKQTAEAYKHDSSDRFQQRSAEEALRGCRGGRPRLTWGHQDGSLEDVALRWALKGGNAWQKLRNHF